MSDLKTEPQEEIAVDTIFFSDKSKSNELFDKTEEDYESDVDSNISADSLQYNAGIVSGRQISEGLSNRGYSADSMEITYLDLALTNLNLTDISKLRNFIYLQTLDISGNRLSDISVIWELKYLLNLNASNNLLESVPCLNPPFNVIHVDLSHNNIASMENIGNAYSLRYLNLNNNKVSDISGLECCESLRDLKLSCNKISEIKGLDKVKLNVLELNYNDISRIIGLDHLPGLQSLQLAYNNIRSLRGLSEKLCLHSLNLEGNNIIDILEVKQLMSLPMLRNFSLINNPINTIPSYRTHILYYLAHLTVLDEVAILPEEKVAAINEFFRPMDEIAAQNHMSLLVKSMRLTTQIMPSTMGDTSVTYPILILTGPYGSGKHHLASRLIKYFKNAFRLIKLYTTKEIMGDISLLNHVSQEEFEELTEKGHFIVTYEVGGNNYGLSEKDIEITAGDGLASVVCMELEGILSFLRTSYKPKIILLSPEDSPEHEKRMRSRERYSEPMISLGLNRTAVYNKYHNDNIGAFDLAIDSTNLDNAFEKVVQLVDYYSGNRSGVGPGQTDIVVSSHDSGVKHWSCGSSSSFDTLQNLPRKRATLRSAVRGELTSSEASRGRSTPRAQPGDEPIDFNNMEFTSTSELSQTMHSLTQLKQVTIPSGSQ